MMNLGEREYVAGWCFDGWVTGERLKEVLLDTVAYVGMTVFEDPVVRDFPVKGKGGEGTLVYHSITEVFVMLHESGIMGNSYSYTNRKGEPEQRVRVLLTSCKEFNAFDVGRFLKDQFDLPMVCRGQFVY